MAYMSKQELWEMLDPMSGEDAIPEIHKAALAGRLSPAQKFEAICYIGSHIDNRADSGMEIPDWMRDAQESVSDWEL